MTLNPTPPITAHAPLYVLLDANLRHPPEYRDQLTNHLPMVLHALHSLGASPQRMQDFYAGYSQRFLDRPVPTPAALSHPRTVDWLALRGQVDAYPVLLTYFNDLVAREGVHGSLRQSLPDLMPGVAAAAFHGAIRTAHAVQAGHRQELAAALAYWAWRWQALEAPPVPDVLLGLDGWAPRLVQESLGWRSSGPLISIRMEHASQSTTYISLAGALAPAENLATRIRQLAGWAVDRYVASPNFTVLHMVTGLRALRKLLPWIEDSVEAQSLLARNILAAYMAAQVKPLDAPPVAAPHPWDAVIAAAITSDDDHVVKLVHACREEATVYGEGNYLRAAALVAEQ
jgi:hypothetical protein